MKLVLSLVFLCCWSWLQAQNLVPNPSFENFTNCPTTLGELPFPSMTPNSVHNWTRPTDGTSDYFQTCGQQYLVDIPENFAGYQQARTGSAYTGLYGILGPTGDYREYLQAKLSSPLVAGHSYYVNYWISLAEIGNYQGVPSAINAVDQMGAHFSNIEEQRIFFTTAMNDLTPQVKSPVGLILADTAGWMNISGSFTAAGNEEYIIIGNFTHSDSFNRVYVVGNSPSARNYYYVDDVCVLDLNGVPLTSNTKDTLFCSGSQVLAATVTGSTYLWDDGSTGNTNTITSSGTYWVKTMSPSTCSYHVDTFIVEQITIVPLQLGNDTVLCSTTPLTLDAYDASYTSYLWNTGATTSSIAVSQAGTYYVHIASECAADSDTIIINTVPLPSATLPQDTLICRGDRLTLRSDENEDFKNTWSNGEVGCCIDITEPGNYTLTVSNICGDQAFADFNASFTSCKDCLFAPTAFSPNGDGLNDEFEIKSDCDLKSFGIKIFNRWGQLVFSSITLDKKWDGSVNGTAAETGVYFFQLTATPSMPNVAHIDMKGDITLVR